MSDIGFGFHAIDGWWFKRLGDGSVHVRKFDNSLDLNIVAETIISPTIWASLVCAVSENGNGRERWKTALCFHTEDCEAFSFGRHGDDPGAA